MGEEFGVTISNSYLLMVIEREVLRTTVGPKRKSSRIMDKTTL
jgi:hypothetical protein